MIATRQLVMEGGLSGRLRECRIEDIADTLHLKDIAMVTTFWLLMGYNFGCMTASDMLLDSMVGFLGSNYLMKT